MNTGKDLKRILVTPLTMTTPVVVELDDPHGVCVVNHRDVVIKKVDHFRAWIQCDMSRTHLK